MGKNKTSRDSDPINVLYEWLFPNGKRYFGITVSVESRRKSHVAAARRGSPLLIHRAIRKYGIENVRISIRVIGRRSFIKLMEVAAIAKWRTTDPEFGYNMTVGGEGLTSEMASIAGKLVHARLTLEQRSAKARYIASFCDLSAAGKKGGKAAMAKRSIEQKIESGRRLGLSITSVERTEIARKGGIAAANVLTQEERSFTWR